MGERGIGVGDYRGGTKGQLGFRWLLVVVDVCKLYDGQCWWLVLVIH